MSERWPFKGVAAKQRYYCNAVDDRCCYMNTSCVGEVAPKGVAVKDRYYCNVLDDRCCYMAVLYLRNPASCLENELSF